MLLTEDREKAKLARIAARDELRRQERERSKFLAKPGDYRILVRFVHPRFTVYAMLVSNCQCRLLVA